MLDRWLSDYDHLPDVWGEGALFGLSGLDGDTNTESGFVASYAERPYGLLFHTPRRRRLDITLPAEGTVRVATGDVLGVTTTHGDLLVAFQGWHTLVGCVPPGTRVTLREENGAEAERRGQLWVSVDDEHGDALAVAEREDRFALGYGRDAGEACERAAAGLEADLGRTVTDRLAYLRNVDRLEVPMPDRLLHKAVSVMKVNTLAPEGVIRRRWSTPDRVPHRHMWLWDSVFHSLAMNPLYPDLAWEFVAAVLDMQRDDGMIPHMHTVAGRQSVITQPPILAWGVWENQQVLPDRGRLEYAVPRLEAYLRWDLEHRDANDNGLLEWYIEANELSRSGESGLDNSPRFDGATLLDAVDFSVFAARDMGFLARLCGALGDAQRAAEWERRSCEMSAQVHEWLWDTEDGFYYDRELDGTWSRVRAVTGFLPLLLDDIPDDHTERLVAALRDPQHFATAFPVPSVAASHPEYSTDMWRGATWLNMNYLVYLGLLKHGYEDDARRLAETSLGYIEMYYREYGVLFEFYDSADAVPPVACDRKGPRREPYDIRSKMDSIRDYHWTAAVTYLWLLAGHRPRRV